MCRKNITENFDFICYTDDISGIRSEVSIVPFVNYGLEVITHNKLFLFSKEFDQSIPTGPRVFFDLDLIIKSNIDDIVSTKQKQLTLIRSSWRQEHPRGFPIWHHMLNSSCMTWESPHTRCLWDHFIKDSEQYTLRYHWGMDCFLSYEHSSVGTQLHMFPERKFMSHLYGVDYFENIACIIKHGIPFVSRYRNASRNIPVVLLNGDTSVEDYEKYSKYYAD